MGAAPQLVALVSKGVWLWNALIQHLFAGGFARGTSTEIKAEISELPKRFGHPVSSNWVPNPLGSFENRLIKAASPTAAALR